LKLTVKNTFLKHHKIQSKVALGMLHTLHVCECDSKQTCLESPVKKVTTRTSAGSLFQMAECDKTCTATVQHVCDNSALSEALLLLSLEYHRVAIVQSGTDNTGCQCLVNIVMKRCCISIFVV